MLSDTAELSESEVRLRDAVPDWQEGSIGLREEGVGLRGENELLWWVEREAGVESSEELESILES